MPYKDPDKQRQYKAQWARMNRAGESGTPGGTVLPLPFRLRTAQDVLDVLGGQIQALLDESDIKTAERARTIAYVSSVALKAVEITDMAERVEALEAILKGRTA